jgi:hypothetical protein
MSSCISTVGKNDPISHREGNIDENNNIKATTIMIIPNKNNMTELNTNYNNTTRSHSRSPIPTYLGQTPKSTYHRMRKQQFLHKEKINQQVRHHKIAQQHQKGTTTTGQEWYGDQLPYHNNWETGEYNETIRLCLININGISQDLNWIEWDTTLKSMYTLQVNILGITEPNINFKNKKVKSNIIQMGQSFERNIQISTSCSNQLNNTIKKKGGTMTILSG